jgi:hypothetical protein
MMLQMTMEKLGRPQGDLARSVHAQRQPIAQPCLPQDVSLSDPERFNRTEVNTALAALLAR